MKTNGNTGLKELPLATAYRSLNIPMMGVCGWEMPAHFGDPEAEYGAARTSVALLDASFLTIVSAQGKDILDYLNRRLSQRVIEQEEGSVQRATQLNGQGRMEADLEFVRPGGPVDYLIAPPAVAGDYLQAVADKYVFTEDAEFVDRTPEFGAMALIGPKAMEIIEECASSGVLSEKGVLKGSINETPFFYYHSEFLAKGVVLFAHRDHLEALHRDLLDKVQAHGGRQIGFLPFDSIRVEDGTLWWGIDMTENTIPLEADLKSAIHTNKGCYPGQETIAKIMNLGHPARKIVGIVWDSEDPLPANSEILVDEKVIGTLTSSSYSPSLEKAIGLATVKWKDRVAGTVVSSGSITGRIVELPFQVL